MIICLEWLLLLPDYALYARRITFGKALDIAGANDKMKVLSCL